VNVAVNTSRLFPYLVVGPVEGASRAVGHCLSVALFEDLDTEFGLSAVTADHLDQEKLTADDAHRIALENLVRFADESPDLSIQVLGHSGGPVHFLLYSDHPRASSCLLLPDLYERASEVLHESELLACVPQRESLVIFPRRDREKLVGKLRAIEADARHPLTFELFALAPNSVMPFTG